MVATVDKNFYVNDLLKSVPTEEQAIQLHSDLREMLSHGGFRLTKWVSNSRRVLETVPQSERAGQAKMIDLKSDAPPADIWPWGCTGR